MCNFQTNGFQAIFLMFFATLSGCGGSLKSEHPRPHQFENNSIIIVNQEKAEIEYLEPKDDGKDVVRGLYINSVEELALNIEVEVWIELEGQLKYKVIHLLPRQEVSVGSSFNLEVDSLESIMIAMNDYIYNDLKEIIGLHIEIYNNSKSRDLFLYLDKDHVSLAPESRIRLFNEYIISSRHLVDEE